ncbi:MAG: two-component system regulatory protein YycI [Bacillota bacterium]|nr:two-component system regulatory protein YycI [Bacillota bacterium]
MSWSKVKTLLIFLFVFVNIFLIYNMYFKEGRTTDVSSQTIADTVKVLRDNNITIDPSAIRRKPIRMKKLEITNSIDSIGTLAENLLGSCEETAKGYENKKGRVVFNSVEFYYENYDTSNSNPDMSDSNAINTAVSFLNHKKFDVKASGVRDYTSNENGYNIRFGKEIDGTPIFESYLQVTISPKGVLKSIEGYWPEVHEQSDSSYSRILCVDQTKILINLLSVEGFDTSVHHEIVDIQTGYTLGSQPESNNPILLTVLPACRITLKTGENYIFDATTGEYIYNY